MTNFTWSLGMVSKTRSSLSPSSSSAAVTKPDPSLSKTPNTSASDVPMLSAFITMFFSLRYIRQKCDGVAVRNVTRGIEQVPSKGTTKRDVSSRTDRVSEHGVLINLPVGGRLTRKTAKHKTSVCIPPCVRAWGVIREICVAQKKQGFSHAIR